MSPEQRKSPPCWWVAADFDKEGAMRDALAYMKATRS
jgi:hypothetical protein